MIRFLCMLCLLICCNCARSQQRGTTVIILGYSRDKIILAADSRATMGDGSYNDHFCKVISLGNDVIFAATGIVSDSSQDLPEDARFEAYSAVRKAYDEIKQKAPEAKMALNIHKSVIDQVALQWSVDLGSRLVKASKLSAWTNQPGGGKITGVFVAQEENKMKALAETLICTPQNIAHNCDFEVSTFEMSEDIHFQPFGTTDVAMQSILPTSNEWGHFEELKSKNPDQADRAFVIRLAELTEDFSTFKKFVGGKIDAVELVPGKKLYWIQQKCECKQKSAPFAAAIM
jgi:hypothetical protein